MDSRFETTGAEGRAVQPPRIPRTCACGGVLRGDYHKHPDGSHWCNQCRGYCGSSGPYGCDMATDHPQNCNCPPCPNSGGCN
jgi:hypothetical protein